MPSPEDHAVKCALCQKIEVQAIVSIATEGWGPATQRMKQLEDQNVGTNSRRNRDWTSGIDIADHIPTDRSCLVQWKSLAVRDGIQACHWKSTDRWSKITKVILPWSKVKGILDKLHG
jgi:hypothetical protein